MALRESIIIAAPAETVWKLIADPERQASWNPKIVSVDRKRSGPVQFGERFTMIYRMSGRESESHVEVIACEPWRRVVLRHRMPGKNAESVVDEAYDIDAREAEVRVVQTVDLSQAGIPWPWRALIWFIHRFGWPTQASPLERMRQLAEPSTAAQTPTRD